MGKDKYADKASGKTNPGGGGKDPFSTRVDDPAAPVTVAAEATTAAPVEGDKSKANANKGRDHIVSYLASVTSKSRHPNLPQELLERMGKCRSKGETKRLLRDHLQKTQVVATETPNEQASS
jgi:hypothetical protein